MHHVKGTRGVKGRVADDSRGGGGIKAYLPFEVEQEIANCLKILDKNGKGKHDSLAMLFSKWRNVAVTLCFQGKVCYAKLAKDRFNHRNDGHVTHISVELIKLAQENQVAIIKLPPHTTHVLQPLDVAVFKGLKTKWDQELCKCQ
ncbi:hypothetical protein ILUMI_15027 [Ignelater luminosus]|uniref:DDE-1 domain-containing protein n=1 Tax=Ignelater luminosus TaxID=2038154 RepID=A0A8K0CTU8_IGNLU|nr:hypothetical protein ILUMI_15027 [Ignelater luminosus]